MVFAPACLLNWDSLREQVGGNPDTGDDVLVEAPDDVMNDAGDGGNDSGPCTLQLSINEVQADGIQGPSDEFVELRNGASCGASLQGFSLRYSSAGGSAPYQVWIGQAGESIGPAGPGGYVILGGFAFQGDGGNVTGRIST